LLFIGTSATVLQFPVPFIRLFQKSFPEESFMPRLPLCVFACFVAVLAVLTPDPVSYGQAPAPPVPVNQPQPPVPPELTQAAKDVKDNSDKIHTDAGAIHSDATGLSESAGDLTTTVGTVSGTLATILAHKQDLQGRRAANPKKPPIGDFVPCIFDSDEIWENRAQLAPTGPVNTSTAISSAAASLAKSNPSVADTFAKSVKSDLSADLVPKQIGQFTEYLSRKVATASSGTNVTIAKQTEVVNSSL
jgi:hypothetical protein